jgi:hypothetical protein
LGAACVLVSVVRKVKEDRKVRKGKKGKKDSKDNKGKRGMGVSSPSGVRVLHMPFFRLGGIAIIVPITFSLLYFCLFRV